MKDLSEGLFSEIRKKNPQKKITFYRHRSEVCGLAFAHFSAKMLCSHKKKYEKIYKSKRKHKPQSQLHDIKLSSETQISCSVINIIFFRRK